ncbi:hypothetical protein [Virgibacillus salexigens]|uniref:hypothetical protein n=1 Tax=Virgibacillus TaxID=84406 RepID=UPI00136FAF26|nr:hypothetical protein [Virgibacillus massiliensis]MYL41792.1 hypothetical protein [Virgibacillus massiliensis]
MEIKVSIDAPGLEGAIHTLAQVMAKYDLPTVVTTETQSAPTQQEQPAPAEQPAPQQQQQQQAVPVQQPQPEQQQQPPVQQQPEQPAQQVPTGSVPTSSPTYTMDQLAVAATQLMDAGKREELINLLSTFNVQALTSLPEDQYGAFATKLREMGANL